MKKKKVAILCMMIMVALTVLAACGREESNADEDNVLAGEPLPSAGESEPSGEEEADKESEPSGTEEAAKESEISEEDSFQSVLRGDKDFTCTDLADKRLNIEEIGQAVTDDDSVTVSAEKFTVIDLDDDGEKEMVLWLQINNISDYGFEVLHAQGGEIYGYTLSYREFMNLKTDGTFTFSGGAADLGIGKMIFSGMEYNIDKQVYSSSEYDAENELIVQYFTDGVSCSADEFDEAMDSQEQKADVKWYDLSEENIGIVF